MVKYTLRRAYAKALEIVQLHPLLPADARHKCPRYARGKKKKKKLTRVTDCVRFQRNINFAPASARYILINNLSALKTFFFFGRDSHAERRLFYSHYNNSILSSLRRLCEIFQRGITWRASCPFIRLH